MKQTLRQSILIVLLGVAGLTRAQSFQVVLKNGDIINYDLLNIETVEFDNSIVKVNTSTGEEDSYSFFDMQKMLMNNPSTAAVTLDETPELKLYPNPATNNLTIANSGTATVARVVNMVGKVMETVQLNSSPTTIDVSSYQSGMYFIVTSTDKYKFIKL